MKPVRFSNLKYMAESPAHYRAHLLRPFNETDAMRLGTAVHSILLSGRNLAVWDGGARRGKAYDAFYDLHADDIILTAGQYDLATSMAAAVMACPETAGLFDGHKERRAEWELAGLPCCGTPDAAGAGFVMDVKTTRSASIEWFIRDAMKRFYHVQLAWYLDGLNRVDTTFRDRAFIVAVESRDPFAVVVFQLSDDALELGRRIYRQWLERLRVCLDCDEWPGYAQHRVLFALPDWLPGMHDDDDEEDETEQPASDGLSLS